MSKHKPNTKRVSEIKRSRFMATGIFVLVFSLIGATFLFRSYAAGPMLYLTPATNTIPPNSDVTLALRLDPGTGVNAIDATIRYDQTKLQYKSLDGTNSAFPGEFITETGNGQVHVVRAAFNTSITTDSEVVKVTFTSIARKPGSTTLTVTGEATDGGTPVILSFGNATVNVKKPGGKK